MFITIEGNTLDLPTPEVKAIVLARDAHTCRLCGYKDPSDYYERQMGANKRKSGLVLHHRRYAKESLVLNSGRRDNSSDPYTLEDFLTLCSPCNVRNPIRERKTREKIKRWVEVEDYTGPWPYRYWEQR